MNICRLASSLLADRRRTKWRSRAAVAGAATVYLAACATGGQFPKIATTSPPPAPADFSLFLIGDAGEPAPSEPVLAALEAEVTSTAGDSAVVFLGDNIYPRGLPPATDPDRARMAERLQAQIDAVPRKARVIFVPGNHDWAKGASDGLEAIRAQGGFIEASNRAEIVPRPGCPGPAINDELSPRLRLIAIDTQWWLHGHKKETSSCAEGTEAAVLAALERALASAGDRRVVVTSHHPMLSSGPHGSFYRWFEWLAFPYPVTRILLRQSQDLGSGEYRSLRSRVGEVMRQHPPLLYAAGHEHTQEVLTGDSARFFVVTGAGIYGHLSATGRRHETLFKHAASGFMRLDVLNDGRAWLTVLEVDKNGRASAVFGQELQ